MVSAGHDGWFVGLEERQLPRLFAPIYNWREIYSRSVYIKTQARLYRGLLVL
jgi:hypothetical protein